MSNIDGVAEHIENNTEQKQHHKKIKLKLFYQKFRFKFVALCFLIIITIGLTSALFYQTNVQDNATLKNQLIPIKQALKQINALQAVEQLIEDILQPDNTGNLVKLHDELIILNRNLLQAHSDNKQVFQQWLDKNLLAEDVVSRVQDSYTYNQQLRQSSIIQLQLVLFSIQQVIDEQFASQKILNEQLEVEQAKNRVTYSRANLYVQLAQKSNDLQQLKTLLIDVLMRFKALNTNTSLTVFEELRLQMRQLFTQHQQIISDGLIKGILDVNQQFDTLEKIVLTEQKSIPKWQSYIRLVQDYQTNLKEQQEGVKRLLLTPYKNDIQTGDISVIKAFLASYTIELSEKNIVNILLASIALSLLCFFFLLWRLHKQIKISAQQGVESIVNTINNAPNKSVVANCIETQVIIDHLEKTSGHLESHEEPQHNEDEWQVLLNKYQAIEQVLSQQEKTIEELHQNAEQQKLRLTLQIFDEMQRYQFLKKLIVQVIQQHQEYCLNVNVLNATPLTTNKEHLITQLMCLYQQFSGLHLALEMKSDKSRLTLTDVNLIDEIYAALFNKQQEQHKYDNKLFVRCDERLLSKVKVDDNVFQHFISLLIDIVLTNCRASQLLLQAQLQDKNEGQQLVNLSVIVNTSPLKTLPTLIMQLLNSESVSRINSPLIDAFNLLLTKQHGENISAELVDDGYQLSFDLPLAVAAPEDVSKKITLNGTNIMVLSNNVVLAELIATIVLSAHGKLERITQFDSFKSQFIEEKLNRKKFDVVVVTSDIAVTQLDFIIQQINLLPESVKPKLMVLQSSELNYERFGFYNQAEQIFCKDSFVENILKLLKGDRLTNQLFPYESFVSHEALPAELPLLLAVQSPQAYQNLQRLLHWLGFHVKIVANEYEQAILWKTGVYNILVTEFPESALIERATTANISIGVLSLTDMLPKVGNRAPFAQWLINQLNFTDEITLVELAEALAPWLKKKRDIKGELALNKSSNQDKLALPEEGSDDVVITEVTQLLTDNAAVFDFARYLQHQGTVELALFMLDEYTQDNHQQLDALIEAIKEKELAQAHVAIAALALNAAILSAPRLQLLCTQWSKLLSGVEIPSSLEKVNALLKETRVVLTEIDEYAETL
jgi:HPt (histidine-containing phosphotransfer) domain-containing protein